MDGDFETPAEAGGVAAGGGDVGAVLALTLRRPVKRLPMPGVEIAPVQGGGDLAFVWVEPTELLVDDAYQRALSERSIALIRRIVGAWDWRRFKPPIVARTEAGLEVIDGQHTAIAAASHPAIAQIPVVVIAAETREDRAGAFIGHNRDRLGVTATQLHHSAVAAGDPEAVAIADACRAAGLTLLANQPGNSAFRPRDTMAVKSIAAVVKKHGHDRAVVILKALADAELAPVSAGAIKAAAYLLTEPEYANDIEPTAITEVFQALGSKLDQEADVFAPAHGVPKWKGLAIVLFKKARKGRRRAA